MIVTVNGMEWEKIIVKIAVHQHCYLLSPLTGSDCNVHACSNIDPVFVVKKMPQRRDNAGAVCNSGMGMLFLCIYLFYIISLRGGVEFF